MSPYLFAVCLDELSVQLGTARKEYTICSMFVITYCL